MPKEHDAEVILGLFDSFDDARIGFERAYFDPETCTLPGGPPPKATLRRVLLYCLLRAEGYEKDMTSEVATESDLHSIPKANSANSNASKEGTVSPKNIKLQ